MSSLGWTWGGGGSSVSVGGLLLLQKSVCNPWVVVVCWVSVGWGVVVLGRGVSPVVCVGAGGLGSCCCCVGCGGGGGGVGGGGVVCGLG